MCPTDVTGASAINGLIICEKCGCIDNSPNMIAVPCEWPMYANDSERIEKKIKSNYDNQKLSQIKTFMIIIIIIIINLLLFVTFSM